MRASKFLVLALVISLLLVYVSSAQTDHLLWAKGVVVAIQGGKTDARIIVPGSLGDLAEIYMVRVDRWSTPRKENYVLFEYVHHTGLISYDQFDKRHWKFELNQYSPEQDRDCRSWMPREGAFHPTTFGASSNLPDPKTLTCFLLNKRPSAVRGDL
jgi:hypothetical protein